MDEPSVNKRNVFVVHGRNNAARKALFAFLRSINLNPLEWSSIVKATGKQAPYIGEILDKGFQMATAAVVLMTPDDEARLKPEFWQPNEEPYEMSYAGQPRQNVLFEAGMSLGKFEDKVVVVELGRLRPMSDIGGRHVVRMDNSVPTRQELATRLRTAGCDVNTDGTDWHSEGDFLAAIAGDVAPETPSVDEETEATATKSSPGAVDEKHGVSPTLGDFVSLGEFLWYLSNPPRAYVDNFVKAIRAFLEQIDRCNLPNTRAAAKQLENLQLTYDIRTNLISAVSMNELASMMGPIGSVLRNEVKQSSTRT